MITKRNQYKGFTTKESINADKIVDYLDRFSFNVTKKTVIVLDNASVHRNRKVKELREIWEKRGLYLFYLPPYSPELNPAEILWRILKGKWIRPIDYETTDSLFYCTNRALASVGTNLFVNYSYLCIQPKIRINFNKGCPKRKNAVAILQILAERIKFTFRPFGIAPINTSDKIPKVIFSILWTGFPPWHTSPDARL